MTPAMREAYPWLMRKLNYWGQRTEIEVSDLESIANLALAKAEQSYKTGSTSKTTWLGRHVDYAIREEYRHFYGSRRSGKSDTFNLGDALESIIDMQDRIAAIDPYLRLATEQHLNTLPEKSYRRALLWAQGFRPYEIARLEQTTGSVISLSLKKCLPYYMMVQREECPNGHIRSKYNTSWRKDGIHCLHCDRAWGSANYYGRKKTTDMGEAIERDG